MISILSRSKAFFRIDICRNHGNLELRLKRNLSTQVNTAKPPPRKPGKGTDFLLNHGGKVALVALSVSSFLIYTYYLSIKDRNMVEEDVEHSTIIEPYEIQQLRYANGLPKDAFLSIAKRVYENSSTNGRVDHGKLCMTYTDFVKIVQQYSTSHYNNLVSNGHLLDRVIYQHTIQQQLHTLIFPNKDEFVANGTTKWYEMELPVDYLLVVLSLVLESDPTTRLTAFYKLLQDYSSSSAEDKSKGNNISQGFKSIFQSLPVHNCICFFSLQRMF
jgi:hypothetical protein